MYAAQNGMSNSYASECIGSSMCEKLPEVPPVERAISRLSESIAHAQAQGAELQGRLRSVLIPRPTEAAKTGGQAGTTCALEDQLNIMADQVRELGRQLRETREMLAI